MLKLLIIFHLFYAQSFCFDKGISFYSYRNCEREVIVEGDGSESGYMRFQNFIPIANLSYNKANNGEILSLRFYFQGRADFSVIFSPQPKQPSSTEKIFQTVLAYGKGGERRSSIFLNNVVDIYKTTKCDHVDNIPNPMDPFFFQQVDVIVNKNYGLIMWFIPQHGRSPLLTCFDPNIVNIKYIGFSGFSRNKVRYIFDCPIKNGV
uniref:Farnesoic acid O-methyl transferase domain-containing protein n=1 Tax=Megaselia scalaris TaxID=36166 RepID=T1H2B6_MEGSC